MKELAPITAGRFIAYRSAELVADADELLLVPEVELPAVPGLVWLP